MGGLLYACEREPPPLPEQVRPIRTFTITDVASGTEEGRARMIAWEPVGRMGKPEEIASAVLWLCSDAAAFLVGHAMVMDGGQTA